MQKIARYFIVLAYQSIPVDSFFGRLLQKVRRRWIAPPPPADTVFQILEGLCLDSTPVRFAQVGSNDGIAGDPLRHFISRGFFTGVLIEPVPYLFQRLSQNYQDVPGIFLENVAIAPEPGEKIFWHLRPSTDQTVPLWYDQLGSFDRDLILRSAEAIPSIPELLTSILVTCDTLENVCRRHDLNAVDLIHIDAEGYDFEIIKSLDLAVLSPTILLYEHKHLGISGRLDCREHLSERGYDCLEIGGDTICIRRRALSTNAGKRFIGAKRARRAR